MTDAHNIDVLTSRESDGTERHIGACLDCPWRGDVHEGGAGYGKALAEAGAHRREPSAPVVHALSVADLPRLRQALTDAEDYRRDGTDGDGCGDCTHDTRCEDHERDLALADAYAELHAALNKTNELQ